MLMLIRKRIAPLFSLLLLPVIGVTAWQVLRPREPSYQGKPLSVWLEGYNPYRTSDSGVLVEQPEWRKADESVRHLGTNAIPTLLKMLRARDTAFKTRLMRLAQKQHIVKIKWTSAAVLNAEA